MPSSRPNHIPFIIDLTRRLNPESILDVGVGFGKWGHLFREYTDILASEFDAARYKKAGWKVRLDGIEGHANYLTPMHQYLYDRIHCGVMPQVFEEITSSYDLVFMGDVLEHFPKDVGFEVLAKLLEFSNKAVVISTPVDETGQASLCDNDLEIHRSIWSESDFSQFDFAKTCLYQGNLLIAVLAKDSSVLKVVEGPFYKFRASMLISPNASLFQRICGSAKAAARAYAS